MRIVKDGYGLIIGSGGVCALLAAVAWAFEATPWIRTFIILGVVAVAFFVYFFRDPERFPPNSDDVVISGADGVVRAIEPIREERYMKGDTVRISIFLNPFDVHVNRSPITGTVTDLAYTSGKHLLTISNASSEHNEHSSILIESHRIRCLVRQIVGPVVRRVVYWLEHQQPLAQGDRIGMMKFGSRMDIYLPLDAVDVTVQKGDRVRAGETVIARIKESAA